MKIVHRPSILHQMSRRFHVSGRSIGFVPTMGALHAGHASLLRRCRLENDIAILSIFLNPLQFGQHEDLAKYPRDFKKDQLLAKKEKIDIIFHPSEKLMYPDGILTQVRVPSLAEELCGPLRPGHFEGVVTVVAKLLNIVSPDRLYLGQKDAQQAAILRRMVTDLNFPTQVKVLPTIRERDGLAMSSRNAYLDPRQRQAASVLFAALRQAQAAILQGERNSREISNSIRSMIQKQASGPIDYIQCVDAQTLRPLTVLKGKVLIALAVWFGRARLIDNVIVQVS